MKMVLKYALALALAIGVLSAAADEPILSVAVFDFESKDEGVRDMGSKAATLINAELSANPQIVTVERAELEKVLSEHELGLSGAVSPDSAAKVGNLTGAKVLVTGRIFETDGELILVAKIIGTETSRVYGELAKGRAKASLPDLSAELAKKIAADITQKSSTLLVHVGTPEQRVEKLKKELGDKRRPSVSVQISEQHFGQRVIDPAAQTELSLILQQCGFPLVDDASTNKPEIDITGEAISEFGARKGNLQSCRGRIEITVRNHSTKEIIAVDRQTCVGLDLAEHIAAKTALQNGATDLASRIIPKLVK